MRNKSFSVTVTGRRIFAEEISDMSSKSETLSRYFDKLCTRAEEDIQRYVLTADPAALQKLRVTLKKTDTLLLVLRFSDENFDYKRFRYPLKRIFDHAGLIREAMLMTTRLERVSAPESIADAFTRFEEIKDSERALFVYKAGIYLRGIKKERNDLNAKVERLDHKQVRMFLKYQLRRLQHLIKRKDAGQLHNVRKKIKRVLYANEFLRELNGKSFLSAAELAQWDVLQNAVGQWNDRREMFSFLAENSSLPPVSLTEQQSGLEKDSTQLWNMLDIRMKMIAVSSGKKKMNPVKS